MYARTLCLLPRSPVLPLSLFLCLHVLVRQQFWGVMVQRGSIRRGARAVHARCGYWGCSVDPFIQSQSGGMVTPQSPPGTIYNSSPSRPSPREVVQIPDAVHARCARGADTPPKGVGSDSGVWATVLILEGSSGDTSALRAHSSTKQDTRLEHNTIGLSWHEKPMLHNLHNHVPSFLATTEVWEGGCSRDRFHGPTPLLTLMSLPDFPPAHMGLEPSSSSCCCITLSGPIPPAPARPHSTEACLCGLRWWGLLGTALGLGVAVVHWPSAQDPTLHRTGVTPLPPQPHVASGWGWQAAPPSRSVGSFGTGRLRNPNRNRNPNRSRNGDHEPGRSARPMARQRQGTAPPQQVPSVMAPHVSAPHPPPPKARPCLVRALPP